MKRLTLEIFVLRAIQTHGAKYDYSHSKYINSDEKIEIICKKHGAFFQRPLDHIKGKGCPICGREQSDKKRYLTQEEFIEKCKKIHGNKYDYSKSIYMRANAKVTIICPKHGEFFQAAQDHMNNGRGCPQCGNDEKHNKQVMSQEDVINICNKANKNKYTCDKFVYKNSKIKTIVTCPIHGDFLIKPESHMKGHGCIKCRDELSHSKQSFTTQEFIEKSKKLHSDQFDYSETHYVNNTTPIKIRCLKHNIIFAQYPQTHFNSETGGCPLCRSDTIKTKNSYMQGEILALFIETHGNKYDYSKFIYTGITSKGIIICRKHGEFLKDPFGHIRGEGCQKCSHEITAEKNSFTKEQFIENAKNIHGDLYDYSLVRYVNARTKVKIICKQHGVFEQIPYAHVGQGTGCPNCKISHWEDEICNWLVSIGEIIERKNRTILSGKEIDIYLPKKKIGIELNGCVYHTAIHSPIAGMNKGKEITYHQDKAILAEQNGISLYQFWDDMDENTIKGILSHKLHHCKNISANTLEIRIISDFEALKFFSTKYRRINSQNFFINTALSNGKNIIAIMVFSKSNNVIELVEYDTLQNISVVNGFQKLLSFSIPLLEKLNVSKIVSKLSCDLFPVTKNTPHWEYGFKYDGREQPELWFYVLKNFE
jgi:hypothetical protein